MFDLTDLLVLTATSADRRGLDAVEHAQAHRTRTRDFIPDHDRDGRPVDVSFASQNWQKTLTNCAHPGRFARRHCEACVFTYLAEELRTGDVAVAGSKDYADWSGQLLAWEECEARLPVYLAATSARTDLAMAIRPRTRHPCLAARLAHMRPSHLRLLRSPGAFARPLPR
ncbi:MULTISPECIES: hypothetical protein [Protofrankia]|uniref:hypothetical protein n=1 Tax=Protofrankia TaxID=2994361 RepID=UPI0001C5304A|nr:MULTISPECIES: hypothetical protein [Protofrankia]